MLITARSISHTIQMAERFFEDYEMECEGRERRLGRAITTEEANEAKVETATTAMAKLMLPGMLGILADAAGLAVCFLTTIQTMRDLSIFGSFWVVAIIFNVILLHPIMIAYSPRHAFKHFHQLMQRFLAHTGALTTGSRSKYVLAGGSSLALALATYYVLFNTTIGESRPGVPVFWPDHPFNVATGKIGEKFGGVDQLTVFVDGDGKSASSDGLVLQRMEAMQRYMRKYVDPGATSSLVDIIKSYWLVNHTTTRSGASPTRRRASAGSCSAPAQQTPAICARISPDDAEDANITVFRTTRATIKRRTTRSSSSTRTRWAASTYGWSRTTGLRTPHYLLGPVLFPKHVEMEVRSPTSTTTRRSPAIRRATHADQQSGRAADPAVVEKDVVGAIKALASEAAGRDRAQRSGGPELDDGGRKIADKPPPSTTTGSRASTGRPTRSSTFATVGELVDYIVARNNYYVVAEWKNDEGNITAQTLRYCRTYCNYELWTQNTKFKDVSFHPQRTNTYTRGAEFVLAGGIMGVYAAVNEEVERGHVANILLIFFICYLFVAVSYRSNAAGLIIVFSLACATIGSLAYMAWRQTGLTIQTLPVQSVGVGVGVDYAFYIIDRIRQEYSWCQDIDEAIRRAIRTTGMAVTFTATTLVAGILPWSVSNLRFQAEMAQLLSILMFVNMLGAIYLVPAWFSIVRPRFVISSLTEATQQHEMRLAALPHAAAGSAR
jgi:predicted RND superfamily exporter protein